MSSLRTILAWVAAIAAFLGVEFIASVLGAIVGVPVTLDVEPYTVHYGRFAEEERSSITTTYGWGVHILSVLAAMAIWYLVKGRRTTSKGRAYFFGFLLGSIILIVGGVPLWKAFANSDGLTAILGNFLELGLLAAAILAGKKLSDRLKTSS